MVKIKQLFAREILNSKGVPSVEVTVELQNNQSATASSSSGTMIGSYEAAEIRDADMLRFHGMGVLRAINNIQNFIAPKLIGMEVTKQAEIDKMLIELDGTQNKSRMGANATMSVSMAVAKAGAISSILPLFLYIRNLGHQTVPIHIPIPIFTLLEGGRHMPQTVEFQDFLLLPASSASFTDALQLASTITTGLSDIIVGNGLSIGLGDEGGYGPKLSTNYDGLSLITHAIDSTNYRLGFDVFLGLDVASNAFYANQRYQIKDKSTGLSSKNLIEYYAELANEFHVLYLEDPLAEDDWDGWTEAMGMLAQKSLIASDALTATNPYRLQMAMQKKCISAIVIKPNQVGTVLESLAVVEVARAAGMKIVVSERAGETNDTFIADFAVAVGADYFRGGGVQRGERVIKYNRFMEIADHIKLLK